MKAIDGGFDNCVGGFCFALFVLCIDSPQTFFNGESGREIEFPVGVGVPQVGHEIDRDSKVVKVLMHIVPFPFKSRGEVGVQQTALDANIFPQIFACHDPKGEGRQVSDVGKVFFFHSVKRFDVWRHRSSIVIHQGWAVGVFAVKSVGTSTACSDGSSQCPFLVSFLDNDFFGCMGRGFVLGMGRGEPCLYGVGLWLWWGVVCGGGGWVGCLGWMGCSGWMGRLGCSGRTRGFARTVMVGGGESWLYGVGCGCFGGEDGGNGWLCGWRVWG